MVWRLQTVFILKPIPGASFACAKIISAFIWHDSTAHDEDGSREQRTHLNIVTISQDFHIEFGKSMFDL